MNRPNLYPRPDRNVGCDRQSRSRPERARTADPQRNPRARRHPGGRPPLSRPRPRALPRPRPRPSLAADHRPLPDTRLRDHAPADAGRAGRRKVPGVHRPVPRLCKPRPGSAERYPPCLAGDGLQPPGARPQEDRRAGGRRLRRPAPGRRRDSRDLPRHREGDSGGHMRVCLQHAGRLHRDEHPAGLHPLLLPGPRGCQGRRDPGARRTDARPRESAGVVRCVDGLRLDLKEADGKPEPAERVLLPAEPVRGLRPADQGKAARSRPRGGRRHGGGGGGPGRCRPRPGEKDPRRPRAGGVRRGERGDVYVPVRA